MQSKATTVPQYLAELPADRRSAIENVRAVILKNLDPAFEEGMQYGMIGYYVPHRVYPPGYHCDPKQPLPFICLASQKNYMSLYLGCVYGPEREKPFREAWAKTGKKLDMGKSCVRFRKLEDLALDVIGAAIRRTRARAFIRYYEAVVKNAGGRDKVQSISLSPGAILYHQVQEGSQPFVRRSSSRAASSSRRTRRTPRGQASRRRASIMAPRTRRSAKVSNLMPRLSSKRRAASISPITPSCTRSPMSIE